MPIRKGFKIVIELFFVWIIIFAVSVLIPDLQTLTRTLIVCFSAIGIEFVGIYYFTRKEEEKIDFYSPIHEMIVELKKENQTKRVNQLNVGIYVNLNSLEIDHKKISQAFIHHSSEFKDSDLTMWRKIEKEIEQKLNGGGFYLDKEHLKWFNSLEKRYYH